MEYIQMRANIKITALVVCICLMAGIFAGLVFPATTVYAVAYGSNDLPNSLNIRISEPGAGYIAASTGDDVYYELVNGDILYYGIDEQTHLRLTAHAFDNSRYEFSHWTSSTGLPITKPASPALSIGESHGINTGYSGEYDLVAVFTKKYNITVTANPADVGNPSADYTTATPGTVVKLTPAPRSTARFDSWTVICEKDVRFNKEDHTFIMPEADITIIANYVLRNYTTFYKPWAGSIALSSERPYYVGDTVTFTAVPTLTDNNSVQFSHWNAFDSSTENLITDPGFDIYLPTNTITLADIDYQIHARFSYHYVNLYAGRDVDGTPFGTVSTSDATYDEQYNSYGDFYVPNNTITATATPNSGYRFDGWYLQTLYEDFSNNYIELDKVRLSSNATYTFTVPEHNYVNAEYYITAAFVPINNTSGSSGGGSSGGGGSSQRDSHKTGELDEDMEEDNLPTSPNVLPDGTVDPEVILMEIRSAVAAMSMDMMAGVPEDTVYVTTVNAHSISDATIQAMAEATPEDKELILRADTTNRSGSVIGRLYVEPAKLTNFMGNLKLGVTTAESEISATREKFQKWYSNTISVIHLDQQGLLGASFEIAVKLNLAGMDLENLIFYTYDPAANVFYQLMNPNYSIDSNGYLHFFTTAGGDIIVTDALLTKK